MHILLFILYSVAGCYAIVRLPFFRNSGLRPGVLLLLFALHVGTGCLHNVIAWHFYPNHGDIWTYYQDSISTWHELRMDFHAFLRDNSTWNYYTHNSLVNIHLMLNFFSRENLYIDTLLFSFPVFLGTTALFRVFRRHFPDSTLTALSAYLLPSVLFWTSCVHREGALFMFLGLFLYSLDRLSSAPAVASPVGPSAPLPVGPLAPPCLGRPSDFRALLSAALFFLLIAYFRAAVALTLVPALIIQWWPSLPARLKRKKWLLTGVIGGLIVLVLAGPLLLKALAQQQESFQVLKGNSRINLPVLDGTPASLLHTLPAAMLNGWFEPLPGTGGQKIYGIFSIELLLIWAVVVLALLRRPALSSFSIGCILFALLGMLLVGLIVPFVGAIVRYRSIYLPFVLAPFLYHLCKTPLLRRFDQWTTHKL
ncbi:MAG TPA: hypothetical protein VGS79_05365 [Puia sp.]|nr:hypothetical protein [Puia sp.]